MRFDIDAIADHSNPLPHMLPSAEQFARDVGELGIAETDTIVVYDGAGISSAPRVWWTFRLFGAEKVFILDGGLPRWKAQGRPLEQGAVKRAPRTFKARQPRDVVASLATVQAALRDKSAQVVDSRPADRFRGDAPEPRPGVRSGHMPGAFNVPSSAMIDNGTLARPHGSGKPSPKAGSISTSRSSPVAAPASLPPRPGSRSTRSARNREAFTTVHGRNGARGDLPIEPKPKALIQMARSKAPVALVTGAAHGIGRAIAQRLLEDGFRLGVLDLPGSGLSRGYAGHARRVALIEGDVADEATARRAVDAVTGKFGRLDGLVSNAGIMVRKPLRALTLRRLAQGLGHQPDRRLPVRPRCGEGAARLTRRHRHRRVDPCADVERRTPNPTPPPRAD